MAHVWVVETKHSWEGDWAAVSASGVGLSRSLARDRQKELKRLLPGTKLRIRKYVRVED